MIACLSFDSSRAQRVAAVDEFLKPIISGIAADPNVGGWNWEVTNKNGGYLLRMQMDVTGDGRPELFVASTLEANSSWDAWHVFYRGEDDSLRPYAALLQFGSGRPVKEGGQITLDTFPIGDREKRQAGDEKSYYVARYLFAFPTISRSVLYITEEEALKRQPPDEAQLPRMEAVLLSDYLTKRDFHWTQVTSANRRGNGCFYLEADRERMEKNTTFTPQVALAKLEGTQPASPPPSPKASPLPAPLPDPLDGPKTGQKAFEGSLGSSTVKTVLAVVILVASLGLLRWLIKRRS